VLITGAVVIEVVFSWPGLGLHMIQALGGRDYPLLQGAILLAAALVVLFNLFVDLLYGWLDPRIRFA
jgi:ABC-type dipeptide/oligopeptide/nickel transport system permease component